MSPATTNIADMKHDNSMLPLGPSSVVVPLDGSKDAESALPFAAYFATLFGVEIRVVHAIRRAHNDDPAVAKTFERYVAELATNGHLPAGVRAEVSTGEAFDCILQAASETDLLVLATHGQGGLRSALFGSVADKVVRGSRSLTVVVPITHGPAHLPIRRIVVAVDESDLAAHAAAIGREFADRCGATVALVNSYLPAAISPGLEASYVPLDAGQIEQRAAASLVANVAEPGEQRVAVLGSTIEAIAETAQELDADLIVVGGSNRGYFSRLLLGNVSEGLMHHLDRPILVVPAREG